MSENFAVAPGWEEEKKPLANSTQTYFPYFSSRTKVFIYQIFKK